MPKGPECQKRPAVVIGKDGGEAKPVAQALTTKRRKEIAQRTTASRWKS